MKTQSAPQIGLSSSEDLIADLVLPEYWTQEERCNSQNSPSVPVYFATGVAVIGLRLTFKVKPPPLVEWRPGTELILEIVELLSGPLQLSFPILPFIAEWVKEDFVTREHPRNSRMVHISRLFHVPSGQRQDPPCN